MCSSRDSWPLSSIETMEKKTRSSLHAQGLQPELQARVSDLIEQAIIVTDLEGTVASMNPYAEQLYGWKAAEALGRNVMEVAVPERSSEQDLASRQAS